MPVSHTDTEAFIVGILSDLDIGAIDADEVDNFLIEKVDGYVDCNLTPAEVVQVVSDLAKTHGRACDDGVVYGEAKHAKVADVISVCESILSSAACSLIRAEIDSRIRKSKAVAWPG